MPDTRTGAELIAAERNRQIESKGYTAEHDAHHRVEEFVDAALTYASVTDSDVHWVWPWNLTAFRPSEDRVRNLVKAGALIAAAIDAEQQVRRLTDKGRHA